MNNLNKRQWNKSSRPHDLCPGMYFFELTSSDALEGLIKAALININYDPSNTFLGLNLKLLFYLELIFFFFFKSSWSEALHGLRRRRGKLLVFLLQRLMHCPFLDWLVHLGHALGLTESWSAAGLVFGEHYQFTRTLILPRIEFKRQEQSPVPYPTI